MHIPQPTPALEAALLEATNQFALYLRAEVVLAQQGDGFFEKKYWHNYLTTKYASQDAANKFYVLLHELSK